MNCLNAIIHNVTIDVTVIIIDSSSYYAASFIASAFTIVHFSNSFEFHVCFVTPRRYY